MVRERSAIGGAKKWSSRHPHVRPHGPDGISRGSSRSLRIGRRPRARRALQRAPVESGRGRAGDARLERAQARDAPLGARSPLGQGPEDRQQARARPRRDGRQHERIPRRASHASVSGGGRRLLRMAARGKSTKCAVLRPAPRWPTVRARGPLEPLGLGGRRGHRVLRDRHPSGQASGPRHSRPDAARARARSLGPLARPGAHRSACPRTAPRAPHARARRLRGELVRQRPAPRRRGLPRARPRAGTTQPVPVAS